MWKKKKDGRQLRCCWRWCVVTGLCWYILYIRQQFYDEGTRNLLETYEQVDKSFPSSAGATGTCQRVEACRLRMRRAWRRGTPAQL